MKKEDIFEALNDVDDELIKGAEGGKKKKSWAKWAGLAACVCVVMIGALTIFKPYEAGSGIDAGGADPGGITGHYSIAVYPEGESEENVADAEIITLSEAEAYSFVNLGEHLPTTLPDGYFYQTANLYKTVMKDGSAYYMLRVTYANGERPEEIVTEDGGVMISGDLPDSFDVTVWSFVPDTDREIYAVSNAEAALTENEGYTVHFELESGVVAGISTVGQSVQEMMTVINSMK